MKLSLLLLCLSCVYVTTAQRPDEGCIQCLKENNKRCYQCLRPCILGPPSACQNCVRISCPPCVRACSEYDDAKIGVTCGSGTKEQFCFQCPSGLDNCQGNGKHPDCIWTKSDNCIPSGNVFDFGPFMDSLEKALINFETNTRPEILFPSLDSCSNWQKIRCFAQLGKGLIQCRKCGLSVSCWISCLKEKICNLPRYCLPGGPCFNDLLKKIASFLGGIFPPKIVEEILAALQVLICSK